MPRLARSLSVAPVSLLLTLASCSARDDAERVDTGAAPAAATPAEGAAPSTGASPTAAGGAIDDRALGSYELTEDKLKKTLQAGRNIKAAERADPQLAARWKQKVSDDPNNPIGAELGAMLERIDREPKIKQAIESAGLMPRDLVMTTFAIISADVASQLKKANAPPRPSGLGAHVSDANVRFVEAHRADVAALMEVSK